MYYLNYYNLDCDFVINIICNIDTVYRLMDEELGEGQSCIFKLDDKELEIRKGEIYFNGKRLEKSMVEKLSQLLNDRLEIMMGLEMFGHGKEIYKHRKKGIGEENNIDKIMKGMVNVYGK